ncbi:TPA: hypothetical protein DCF80_02050 [Candidatus Saccharibacteria bacterium]|nr:hypothetical protein [Candidatus Saccharibacteria bacterium]
MTSFWDSVIEHWRGRTRTQLYAVFAFWWVILHLEFFYTLVFVDERIIFESKNQLKNEYIWSHFIQYSNWEFWVVQAGLFLLAVSLTILMIKWFPKKVVNHVYSWERDNELDRQRRKILYEANLAELKASIAESEKQKVMSEKETEEIRADLSKTWQKEYEKFEKDPAFPSFKVIVDAVYENKGRIKWTQYSDGSGRELSRIPSGLLALVDSLGLVNFDNSTERIELTDKGRYFVGRYPMGK